MPLRAMKRACPSQASGPRLPGTQFSGRTQSNIQEQITPTLWGLWLAANRKTDL